MSMSREGSGESASGRREVPAGGRSSGGAGQAFSYPANSSAEAGLLAKLLKRRTSVVLPQVGWVGGWVDGALSEGLGGVSSLMSIHSGCP